MKKTMIEVIITTVELSNTIIIYISLKLLYLQFDSHETHKSNPHQTCNDKGDS